jgi:hypothetical protein
LRYEARESDVIQFPLLRDPLPKWIHVGTNGNSVTDLAAWSSEANIWSDIRKFQIFGAECYCHFKRNLSTYRSPRHTVLLEDIFYHH